MNPKFFGWCWLGLSMTMQLYAGNLLLVKAAKDRDGATVRSLLKQHVNVNAPEADGSTALHWAVYWDDPAIADALIRAGANVNAADDLGVTPLFLACSNGSQTMVAKLLATGAHANAATTTGETALMAVSRTGATEAVQLLLAHGADVNAKEGSHGQTALMWAVSERHPAVVKVLLDHGADVHARSFVRKVLAYTGVPTIQAGRNAAALTETVSIGGSTPLLFAARQGDVESAKLLLGSGADVNEVAPDETSALVLASRSGQGAFAAFLLDKGADPNAVGAGYTALHAAVLRDDVDLVKTLLAHGANPNARITKATPVPRESQFFMLPAPLVGATPFFLAAKFAEADIMRVLASAGADPLFTMKDGTTALMAASGVGWAFQANRRGALFVGAPTAQDESLGLEAVQVAIALGGNVNAINQAGETAMHGAAAKGFTTIVRLLADKGARVDVKNRRGQTPLAVTPQPRDSRSTAALLRELGAKE